MDTPNVLPKNLYTIEEVCHVLSKSRKSLQRYRSSGALRWSIRQGDHRIVFKGQDILDFFYKLEDYGGKKN